MTNEKSAVSKRTPDTGMTSKTVDVLNDITEEISRRIRHKRGCEITYTINIVPDGDVGVVHKDVRRVRVV